MKVEGLVINLSVRDRMHNNDCTYLLSGAFCCGAVTVTATTTAPPGGGAGARASS